MGSACGFVEVLTESVPKRPDVLGWRLEGDSREQTQESRMMFPKAPQGSPAPTPTNSQGTSYDRELSILLRATAVAEGTLRAVLVVGVSPGLVRNHCGPSLLLSGAIPPCTAWSQGNGDVQRTDQCCITGGWKKQPPHRSRANFMF